MGLCRQEGQLLLVTYSEYCCCAWGGGWKWLDQQKSRRAYKVIQPLESETLELYQELVMDWGRVPKGFLFTQITQKCVIFINRGTSNYMRNKNKTSMFSWSFLVCSTFSHMVSFCISRTVCYRYCSLQKHRNCHEYISQSCDIVQCK